MILIRTFTENRQLTDEVFTAQTFPQDRLIRSNKIKSNPVNSERTRHRATKYKYGIALSQFGVVTYEKVHTTKNPADIGTKVPSP